MINHNGAWLPSVTLGVSALILLALICFALMMAPIVFGFSDESGITGWGALSCVAAGAFAVITVLGGFGYYPYSGDYHRLQPATGTVQAVDSRFLAASQYVVVTYEGGLTVRCDDSRCSTVRVGQQLRLLCTKQHEFGSPHGADGWSCRWGEQ